MQPHSSSLYGVATVGAKGQVVIPADAREQMNIKPGDKLIVFGKQTPNGYGMICLSPLESAEQFVAELTSQITRTKAVIDDARASDNTPGSDDMPEDHD
ncbi:AbrB/MazE/SpoVT family DNA-binding domain-containing protein [Candidatus Saccharibacteria bacterium]|nr:AbrB/MazE/SpoVT family DNA-binding domain-containing protein [Candidatus Saccharibacteria bacterium]